MKRRVTFTGAFGIFVLTLTATTVFAHSTYTGWKVLWDDGAGRCVDGKVTTDHPAGYVADFFGEVDVEKVYNTPFGPVDCQEKKYMSPNQIENRLVVIKKRSDGTGALCYDTGYEKNTGEGWHGFQNHRRYTTRPPCGHGDYKSQTWSYANVLQDGEPWEGGSLITTEWHYL